jgi:hypothetical protein
LGSSIHPEHIDIFHKGSYNGLHEFWSKQGMDVNVNTITSFDPYLGRISQPSNK